MNETLAGATTRIAAWDAHYSLAGGVLLHVYGFIQLMVRPVCPLLQQGGAAGSWRRTPAGGMLLAACRMQPGEHPAGTCWPGWHLPHTPAWQLLQPQQLKHQRQQHPRHAYRHPTSYRGRQLLRG